MIGSSAPNRPASPEAALALVSISAARARILRWRDGEVIQLELPSEVPGRHRSTGHVRHDPRVRHGGSGVGEGGVEGRRQERIQRFLGRVVGAVRDEARVLVLGSGPLPRRLADLLIAEQRGRPVPREIHLETIGYRTDSQLRERLLAEAGHPPPRSSASQSPQVGKLRGRAARGAAATDVLDGWEAEEAVSAP